MSRITRLTLFFSLFLLLGLAGLVRTSAVDGFITQGSKLVAGVEDTARAQRVVEVEGVKLAESASSIGIALEGLESWGVFQEETPRHEAGCSYQ